MNWNSCLVRARSSSAWVGPVRASRCSSCVITFSTSSSATPSRAVADDDEVAADLLRVEADVDLARERLVVDQRLFEPRRQAVAEDPRGDLDRRVVGAEVLRRDVGDVGPRRRHAIVDLDDPLAFELRDPAPRPIQRRSRRQAAEVLLDQPLRLGRIEVAGDHERQVVRRVVAAEELLHVVEGRGGQILHAADDRPRVGMPDRREVHRDDLVGASVRRILEALAPLVLDHVALVVQLLLIGLVEQRRQAVATRATAASRGWPTARSRSSWCDRCWSCR